MILLLLCVLAPLALVPAVALRSPLRPALLAAAPWTALPALLVSLAGAPSGDGSLPYLLLGTRLELDVTGRIFLFFTALLWLAAGVYARSYLADDPARGRFFIFYLLSLSGSLGVAVAHDLASFYLFFALVTFPAYGLIVHEGGAEARRAGRVYMVMAVAGEALLLAGALLVGASAATLGVRDVAAAVAASPYRDAALALLLAGFGIKAGAIPLHLWLPLAHPVAPTPASAVLSGSMIKAGLLGWLRFLPLGEAALPGWGGALVLLGLGGALLGVVVGVTQSDPKTTLAYSSISQMGIMSVMVGLGLMHPGAAPLALAAVVVYALHHSLVKGALFLGVGVADARPAAGWGRRLVAAGMVFAALAMAGAPLTSGSVAKHYLKESAHLAPGEWARWLDGVLPLTVVGTSLLMARFLWLVAERPADGAHRRLTPGLWAPWLIVLLGVGGAVWLVPPYSALGIESPGRPGPGALWSGAWPIGAAGVLFWGAVLALRRMRLDVRRLVVPAGDLLLLAEGAVRRVKGRMDRWEGGPRPDPAGWVAAGWYDVYARREKWGLLLRQERRLTHWSTAGGLALLLAVLLLGLLLTG